MAPRATAESQEQGSGGNTLPAYENPEEESRNTSSEVPHKNIGPRVDSDMAPPDSEASNRSRTPLDLQTTQDSLDAGRGESDGARVVQQAEFHGVSLEKDNIESEQSFEAVTKPDVQSSIDQLQRVFEESRAESHREIDDFMQILHAGKTQSQWIFYRVRRSTVDVIIARATATCMLEDYRAMESHVLKAIQRAGSLSQTSLYASLINRCQYLMGVALYYQQRLQDANDAFQKAGDCPAAPGISLRDANEWRRVIREVLQASRTNSFSGQREDLAHLESPSTPGTQTAPLSPFQSRKLSNILEEVEAGGSNNHSAGSTRENPFEQALPSPGNSPLTPLTDPRMFMPDRFQRRASLKESTTAKPSLRRSASIRSAFASNRSLAMSDGSMNEDNINAAFGGGGEYQSLTNTPTSFQNPWMTCGSAYEKEEIPVGDDLCKQQWVAWQTMKNDEDTLFKRDRLQSESIMARKYEEQRKEAGGEKDDKAKNREKFWINKGFTPEEVRKSVERNKRRMGKQFKRDSS